ncbi:ABC transporter permease [Candidatus Kaiserbacteria bacterium]|nr:ABC transporter permease [Candidatus Kaiserbacteria bacterium]
MNNPALHRIKWFVSDLLVMLERNIVKYVRLPQLMVFSSIQPIMFLLLFTYVFGGAISRGGNYIDYLLPGILAQTVIFGAMMTGVGLAEDLQKGIIDRFKSLPMAHSAFLLGRTITDMIRNIFVIFLMLGIGYLIGFRTHTGLSDFFTAVALLLFFGFAFSWISATIGMLVKNVETAQVSGFIWIFPLVFASSIFVPTETMPDWLRAFADINPVSAVVNAVRGLMLGNLSDYNLAKNTVLAFVWIVGILTVFIPLAVRLYRRS